MTAALFEFLLAALPRGDVGGSLTLLGGGLSVPL